MIAEKLDAQINWLERAAKRSNGDLQDVSLKVLSNMRAEVDRLREMENSGVFAAGKNKEAGHGETR